MENQAVLSETFSVPSIVNSLINEMITTIELTADSLFTADDSSSQAEPENLRNCSSFEMSKRHFQNKCGDQNPVAAEDLLTGCQTTDKQSSNSYLSQDKVASHNLLKQAGVNLNQGQLQNFIALDTSNEYNEIKTTAEVKAEVEVGTVLAGSGPSVCVPLTTEWNDIAGRIDIAEPAARIEDLNAHEEEMQQISIGEEVCLESGEKLNVEMISESKSQIANLEVSLSEEELVSFNGKPAVLIDEASPVEQTEIVLQPAGVQRFQNVAKLEGVMSGHFETACQIKNPKQVHQAVISPFNEQVRLNVAFVQCVQSTPPGNLSTHEWRISSTEESAYEIQNPIPIPPTDNVSEKCMALTEELESEKHTQPTEMATPSTDISTHEWRIPPTEESVYDENPIPIPPAEKLTEKCIALAEEFASEKCTPPIEKETISEKDLPTKFVAESEENVHQQQQTAEELVFAKPTALVKIAVSEEQLPHRKGTVLDQHIPTAEENMHVERLPLLHEALIWKVNTVTSKVSSTEMMMEYSRAEICQLDVALLPKTIVKEFRESSTTSNDVKVNHQDANDSWRQPGDISIDKGLKESHSVEIALSETIVSRPPSLQDQHSISNQLLSKSSGVANTLNMSAPDNPNVGNISQDTYSKETRKPESHSDNTGDTAVRTFPLNESLHYNMLEERSEIITESTESTESHIPCVSSGDADEEEQTEQQVGQCRSKTRDLLYIQ